MQKQDIDQIKAIIVEMSSRYAAKGGEIQFVGVEGSVVKITPAGFCWR